MTSEATSSRRIPVAISACLLGQPVRYDGGNKLQSQLIGKLHKRFVLIPICPEVAIGLGVPRPPIQLVLDRSAIRARSVQEPSVDVTALLESYGRDIATTRTDLCGYVLKARSPSCGTGSVPLFDINARITGNINGVYINAVLALQNELPVADEEQLRVRHGLEEFVEKVIAYSMQLKET